MSDAKGKTQAELDAGFEDFMKRVRREYKEATGREYKPKPMTTAEHRSITAYFLSLFKRNQPARQPK
jgi:hypothetical protein